MSSSFEGKLGDLSSGRGPKDRMNYAPKEAGKPGTLLYAKFGSCGQPMADAVAITCIEPATGTQALRRGLVWLLQVQQRGSSRISHAHSAIGDCAGPLRSLRFVVVLQCVQCSGAEACVQAMTWSILPDLD